MYVSATTKILNLKEMPAIQSVRVSSSPPFLFLVTVFVDDMASSGEWSPTSWRGEVKSPPFFYSPFFYSNSVTDLMPSTFLLH